MLKNLIFVGLAYYFYTDMQKKLKGAMDDRNSLLAMLTPEQRAQLLQGVQTMQNTAGQVVSSVTNALNAPAPTSIPLSGMGSYNYRRY